MSESKVSRVTVIEFSCSLCLIVTLASWALLLRARRELCQARVSCAVLDTVPLRRFRLNTGKATDRQPGSPSLYEAFLSELAVEDATRLDSARLTLRSQGIPFSIVVATRGGGAYVVEARRAATGEDVLWLIDASTAAIADRARKEAESLREMLDAIPVPVWLREPDDTLIDCNRAYTRAVDTTRELAIAENRELAAGARPGDRRHVVIGGARRLLEIGQVPARTRGTIGFAIDRTELEAMAVELWRHINAHAEVLERIRASVAIYGPDKRLRFFNSAFSSMWGIAEDWLTAQPSFEEVLERLREARQLPEAADFRAFKAEQLRMFTSLIEPQQDLMHLPDGRTLLLSISPHPFGGLTFIYEDVTDRLTLERSCNTLTKVRRATLDHLFEGIAVYGSDGRLKLHNPAFLAIWGLSESDVAGEPHIGDILEKTRSVLDDGVDWMATRERMIAKVTAHALASGPVYRNDGSLLHEATVPLPDGNVLVTYLDVTDTARVERALRERNEALETAGRLKSEFIANVSYQLRTPLNAVIGFAEILAKQSFGDLNPRQLDYSRCILQSAQQLMKLINDILDLATIEAGYLVLDTAEVEVFEMLEAVLALTGERAGSRNLQLELRCRPDIGTIWADERRLKQAVFNLVSNAIKFTPPGGAISIEAERRERELSLIVADTGIGIPLADQARVLERFERGRRESGAGLGLALVKSLVELHGGTVAIESTPGRGTRIICRLPTRQPNGATVWSASTPRVEARVAA
jgi:signal transduction histidine kinase